LHGIVRILLGVVGLWLGWAARARGYCISSASCFSWSAYSGFFSLAASFRCSRTKKRFVRETAARLHRREARHPALALHRINGAGPRIAEVFAGRKQRRDRHWPQLKRAPRD